MSGRPMAVLNEAAAREILRLARAADRDSPSDLARALADEIIARGGWKANTCQPLLRAYEICRDDAAVPSGRCERCMRPLPHSLAEIAACPQPARPVLRDVPRLPATSELAPGGPIDSPDWYLIGEEER